MTDITTIKIVLADIDSRIKERIEECKKHHGCISDYEMGLQDASDIVNKYKEDLSC